MTDYMADYQKHLQEQLAKAKEQLLALIPQFQAAGIAYVVAYYDGSGDSGQIEEICFFDATADQDELATARSEGDVSQTSKPEPILTNPTDLRDDPDKPDLEGLFDELCPPGYEDNDGGFGAIILDVNDGKIHVNSASRYTDFNTNDYEV